jgi:hypothetical protein
MSGQIGQKTQKMPPAEKLGALLNHCFIVEKMVLPPRIERGTSRSTI